MKKCFHLIGIVMLVSCLGDCLELCEGCNALNLYLLCLQSAKAVVGLKLFLFIGGVFVPRLFLCCWWGGFIPDLFGKN